MKRLATTHLTRIVMTIVIGVFLTSQMVVAQAESAPASIVWSPDGTMIAGSGKGLLRIWNANTGATLLDLQGVASHSVTFAVSWSADSKRLVSGTDDGVVRIWSISYPNYSVGQLITTISPTNADKGLLYDVAWSPDGSKIAVGRVDSRYSLEIWNSTTYSLVNQFAVGSVTNLSWDATSTKIAFADQNSQLGIQNITSSQQQAVAIGTSSATSTVSWNTLNNYIAIGYVNGEVSIWNPTTGGLISTLSNSPQTFVENIAWSPDNSKIATANGDTQIRFWNASNGQFIQSVVATRNVYAVDWSPDGTKLAYGGNDGTLQIVSVAEVGTPKADTAQSYAYIMQVASGDVQLHRVNPLDPDMTLPPIPIGIPADHTVFQAIRSPDGKWIAMWVNWDGYFQLYVYEVSTSALYMAKQVHSLDLFDDRLITPVWSPNSQYVAFNIFDGTLYSTYLVTPTNRGILTIHSGSSDNALPLVYPIALAWSADTRYLAVVQSDCYNLLCTNNIRAYSVPDISEIGVVKIQGTICDVQWSPDNRRISFAQACDDPNIFYSSDVYIWDIGNTDIERLTHLSTDFSDATLWLQRYATVRSAIWYDADTLLIGTASAKLGLQPSFTFAETATYQPGIGRVSSVSDEVATGWVRNMHSGEFAYYSSSVHDVDEYWINFNVGVIKIATFDGTKLSVIQQIDVPANYDFRPLAWSLDERFVAFSTGDPKSYRFLDKTTGKVTEYSLPATYFITVGWIAQ